MFILSPRLLLMGHDAVEEECQPMRIQKPKQKVSENNKIVIWQPASLRSLNRIDRP